MVGFKNIYLTNCGKSYFLRIYPDQHTKFLAPLCLSASGHRTPLMLAGSYFLNGEQTNTKSSMAMHPQLFQMPWGKIWASAQDRAVWIGHKLARLCCQKDFHQRMYWPMINRFPRLEKYPQCKQLAQASLEAVINARDGP
jgi:hypothetical protein